ncbi:hypothetical protein ADA01nite_42800 [Aneurinibacillus danicus]|uniref:Uncharacterized protein n=1 Tax=Aneurinibacillus danicus TaxID=267746 RepID=A0A511VD54_9BACL|nr:hypothetical protein ADA01nite_42800 [Aneurinibacillus danicus]
MVAVVKLLQYHLNYILARVAYTMLKKKQEFGVVIANMLNY